MTWITNRPRVRPWLPLVSILLLWPVDVLALVENYEPTAGTYVIYTFFGCGLLFLGIITVILQDWRWLHYVVLAGLLMLTQAGTSGALPYLLGGSEFVLWVVPYLVISVTTGFGYYVAGSQLEKPHPLARYRKACYIAAVVAVIGPATSYFWLKVIPLNLMWLPQLVLFYSMYAVLILPPWTWQIEGRVQKLLTRSFPLVTGIPFALLPFFEEPGYGLQGDTAQKLALFGMSAHFVYVWVLAIWLGVSGQAARQAAERRALEASRNEAELQLALRDAEQEYERAQTVAQESQRALATVSHDLKQPLASLRVAVERIDDAGGEAGSQALSRAVDYVEELARAYSSAGSDDANPGDPEARETRHTERERIKVRVLVDSLQQMFSEQAARAEQTLTFESGDVEVLVPPLDAMRVLSNLLSNALQHAGASNISLRVLPNESDTVALAVADDGKGMAPETLAALRGSGHKGADSTGDGLGLAIVDELCAAHGWAINIDSVLGKGTRAVVRLPAPPAELR